MYPKLIEDLARTKLDDRLARAEALRLATAAKQARPPRRRPRLTRFPGDHAGAACTPAGSPARGINGPYPDMTDHHAPRSDQLQACSAGTLVCSRTHPNDATPCAMTRRSPTW